MLFRRQMPFIVPPGAGIETVEDDDPILMRNPLIFEGSPLEVKDIYRKFWDYRIWHKLKETCSLPEVMPTDTSGWIIGAVQELYRFNENDSAFAKDVDSVTLLYPRALEPKITTQLSECPPRLPVSVGTAMTGATRSIHVQGTAGTRSLAIFQRSLDIDVHDRDVFLCLNNPINPSWVAVLPKGKPAMHLYERQPVLNKKETSERAAWERVEYWMRSRGIAVHGQPYPQGENSFPDYRAWIRDEEFDVEMTTVPDLEKWTIKSHYRDLEKRISEIAGQPGETRQDVIQDLNRVLAKKRNSVRKAQVGDTRRRCILVVSNWSTHELSEDDFRENNDLSVFDLILLNEMDKTSCVHVQE